MKEVSTVNSNTSSNNNNNNNTNNGLSNGVRATRLLRTRVGSSGSGGDSPRSLDTPRMRSGLSSPLRPSRQATSSPGDDLSDDSGIRLDKGMYQNMFQDVINIKTLLLRLKRVLQEGDTSNPFDNSLKNGLCYNVASNDTSSAEDTPTKTKDAEQISDLKRQVVFQQHQLDEKERLIQALQAQVAKYEQSETCLPKPVETCNAATQTERVRPLSTGPSLLSGLPSDSPGGSLVSNTSESWSRSLPRQNDNKTNTLSSRVPVGPWRRTANTNTEQTTTRKFLNTPVPQRRSSHPKTS